MIKGFVAAFMANKDKLRKQFAAKAPESYAEIVKAVVEVVRGDEEYDAPDPERIHEIDDGSYQGTLIYVIGAGGYQPDDYWYVKVGYGSCSGCDTLQGIHGYRGEPPTESQIEEYLTLALHIVQGLRAMQPPYDEGGEEAES